MPRRRWTFPPAFLLSLALAGSSTAQNVDPAATAPANPGPAIQAVEKVDAVTREQAEADRNAQAAQKRIDALDDETQKLLADYRKAIADTESYEAYAAQLTRQIASQEKELTDIDRQLAEVEDTSRSITPLQQKMLATLRRFVELDVPFLADERAARVKTLEEMMDRADVSISEKYRRIVEAYQVEMDYGRTIEAYDAQLHGPDGARTASFLRIGRVALLYQTLDGRETGYWDNATRNWKVDAQYAHAFREGVAVARKQSAPEMILAPVPAPVAASDSAQTAQQETRS
jgi:outer membrane murein-binding lipoprotein Lpp